MMKQFIGIGLAVSLSITFLGMLFSGVLAIASTTYFEPMTPPVIINQNPSKNSITATLDTNIFALFNQPISPTSVTTNTFVAHANQTGLITGTYEVQDEEIHFIPSSLFKPGELVQVSITTNTQNLNGEGLVSPLVWQFQTRSITGTGDFLNSEQLLDINKIKSVSFGDLNGDGALDVFVGIADGITFHDPNEVWLNDGTGNFINTGQQLGNSQSYATLGDLDKDGDLDAFVANLGSNKVWFNIGDGTFVDSGQRLGNGGSSKAALGDLDGDGDLDAYDVTDGGDPENQVWLNNGDGTFQAGIITGNDKAYWSVEVGDLDGDNDLDLFLTTSDGNEVWFNNNKAEFSNSGQNLGNLQGQDIALGDLDNDGDLDAFVANGLSLGNQVWFNDGTGFFTDTQQSLGNFSSFAVGLGDLDGDKDLDAIVANLGNNEPNQVWLNNGNGIFSDYQSLGISEKTSLDIGDVDGDGDLDVFLGGFYDDAELWLNQANSIYIPIVIKP